jgi:hypothetical protein
MFVCTVSVVLFLYKEKMVLFFNNLYRNEHVVYDSEGNGYVMPFDLFLSEKVVDMVFPHSCNVHIVNGQIVSDLH